MLQKLYKLCSFKASSKLKFNLSFVVKSTCLKAANLIGFIEISDIQIYGLFFSQLEVLQGCYYAVAKSHLQIVKYRNKFYLYSSLNMKCLVKKNIFEWTEKESKINISCGCIHRAE